MEQTAERIDSTEEIDPTHLESLSKTLFVMWGFPELSQTFIEREFRQMQAVGGEVNILAAYRVSDTPMDDALGDIVSRAVYLGHPVNIVLRGFGYGLRHPRRFFKTLKTLLAMPHRKQLFRLRSAGMVLAAASAVDRLKHRDFRYIQAHFAAYHSELAMALSMLLDVPFGITAHATGIWKDRNILPQKISRARLVATCTCHNLDHLKKIAPNEREREKVHLVYHGLPLHHLPKPTPLPSSGPVRFIAIGRMVPKKGFGDLVDAARMLADNGVPFELGFIGDGPLLAQLKSQVAADGLENRIRFFGKLSNTEVFGRINDAHCLIVPSVAAQDGNMDGIPNVILESMALGRPVIGTRLSGIPEVVEHEKTGLLVPPNAVGELAAAMLRISRDRSYAARLGAEGRHFIHEMFDVEKSVAKQLALLHRAWHADPSAT